MSNISKKLIFFTLGILIGFAGGWLLYSESSQSPLENLLVEIGQVVEEEYGMHAGISSFSYITFPKEVIHVTVSTDPGGYYAILTKSPTGEFNPLFRSQEAPKCSVVLENSIPPSIFSNSLIDECYQIAEDGTFEYIPFSEIDFRYQ